MPIGIQSPNPDMPKEIQDIYLEAANVFPHSALAASVLIRLCLENLLKHLKFDKNGKGKLNDMIGEAVKEGVAPYIQQYMDYCRYIGNNAAHELEFIINDTPENVLHLFEITNEIAYECITRKNNATTLFNSLPQKFKDQIEKRDKKQQSTTP